MDRETSLVGELADNLDGDGGGISDARTVVGAVGWVNEQFESAAIGIDHCVAPLDFAQERLASHGLLAGIISFGFTRLGDPHALDVDQSR